MLWIPDKDKALSYALTDDEMLLTVHWWFYNTDCPGQWLMDRMGELAEKVTAALDQDSPSAESAAELGDPEANAVGMEPPEAEQPKESQETIHTGPAGEPLVDSSSKSDKPTEAAVGLQGRDLANMGIEKALKVLGPIFTEDQRKYGLLASVMLAQAVAESGLNSDLFQYANAAFGMHCLISGNTWKDTVWDGESSYMKNGDYYRAYPSLERCIEDHRNYLLNAMNGDAPRYAGLAGCADAKQAAEIIYKGGYCDNPRYAEALLYYIELYDLDQWNALATEDDTDQPGGLDEMVTISKADLQAIKDKAFALYQAVDNIV